MQLYLEMRLEMWTTFKDRNYHSDGLNANELLFSKRTVLIKIFQQDFIKSGL